MRAMRNVHASGRGRGKRLPIYTRGKNPVNTGTSHCRAPPILVCNVSTLRLGALGEDDLSNNENEGARTKLRAMLEQINGRIQQAHEAASTPRQDPTATLDPEVEALAKRIDWILRAAYAHSQGMMPWRAGASCDEDSLWVDEVCLAVRHQKARPTHPDSDIEQLLLNALPT